MTYIPPVPPRHRREWFTHKGYRCYRDVPDTRKPITHDDAHKWAVRWFWYGVAALVLLNILYVAR